MLTSSRGYKSKQRRQARDLDIDRSDDEIVGPKHAGTSSEEYTMLPDTIPSSSMTNEMPKLMSNYNAGEIGLEWSAPLFYH